MRQQYEKIKTLEKEVAYLKKQIKQLVCPHTTVNRCYSTVSDFDLGMKGNNFHPRYSLICGECRLEHVVSKEEIDTFQREEDIRLIQELSKEIKEIVRKMTARCDNIYNVISRIQLKERQS